MNSDAHEKYNTAKVGSIMICPKCKKETPSIFRICQNCKSDLEQYKADRNKALEGTGDHDLGSGFALESIIINLGPVGGILIMVISIFWFFYDLMIDKIYFYPPALFFIGLYGLISGIKRMKKRKELKLKMQNGKILD